MKKQLKPDVVVERRVIHKDGSMHIKGPPRSRAKRSNIPCGLSRKAIREHRIYAEGLVQELIIKFADTLKERASPIPNGSPVREVYLKWAQRFSALAGKMIRKTKMEING